MFIVYGFKPRHKVLSRGTFLSPATGTYGPYELMEARRWGTVFWIPVIPMNRLGRYVRCATTGRTYYEEILQRAQMPFPQSQAPAAGEPPAWGVAARGPAPLWASPAGVPSDPLDRPTTTGRPFVQFTHGQAVSPRLTGLPKFGQTPSAVAASQPPSFGPPPANTPVLDSGNEPAIGR